MDANQINVIGEEKRAYIRDMDNCEWYIDVIGYLQRMKCPKGISDSKSRTLNLHAIKYVIVSGMLWWKTSDGVMLKCVD